VLKLKSKSEPSNDAAFNPLRTVDIGAESEPIDKVDAAALNDKSVGTNWIVTSNAAKSKSLSNVKVNDGKAWLDTGAMAPLDEVSIACTIGLENAIKPATDNTAPSFHTLFVGIFLPPEMQDSDPGQARDHLTTIKSKIHATHRKRTSHGDKPSCPNPKVIGM
jgi:hypothetical protein